MTVAGVGRPANVRLVPGAMQNWSDLDHSDPHASGAVRTLVSKAVDGVDHVAVVGPAPLDLLIGLATRCEHLIVITRSIPDAVTIGNLLLETDGAQVVCGSVSHVAEHVDAVIALADLSVVQSLEGDPAAWAAEFAAVRRLAGPASRLLLGIENELSLHRMTALRSRYTTDTDADWSVTATFDQSRPRTLAAVHDVVGEAELGVVSVYAVFPTWQAHTIIATADVEPTGALRRLLEDVTLASPAYRQVGADPTRLTRAAVLSGRIVDFASGWLVLTGVEQDARSEVIESTDNGKVVVYNTVSGDQIQRLDESGAVRNIEVSGSARLLSEQLLDDAAAGDLHVLRTVITRYVDGVRGLAVDGVLPAEDADVRLDNVLVDGDNYTTIAPAPTWRPVEDALHVGLADLVRVIRARGSRHPWPVAIDDATMLANLAAMAGLDLRATMDELTQDAEPVAMLPAYDIPGLLAVIERLTETNAALASKATWFEQRLSVRDREMRVRVDQHRSQLVDASRQQEILRSCAEDIRRSLTYRIGNVILGPVRSLRAHTRDRR